MIVAISPILIQMSSIIGWLYFIAWSISFYPQIYTNFRRKSVIGLNFDFLALNILGFVLYSVFNVGLYFSPVIQSEYSRRYPRGLNPVQLNDVFFAGHAAFATLITIIQCFLYDVSWDILIITEWLLKWFSMICLGGFLFSSPFAGM